MTEHPPERIWSSIDIPKTIAGVLAAVSAAVIGSFLGVAGTLAGAAVASIIGSVGTEIYQRWIDRGSKKIKSTFVAAPAAVGTPPVAAQYGQSDNLYGRPVKERRDPRKLRWGRAAIVAAALFVLAMALLTAFELVTHKSLADAVGNGSGKRTTIGSFLTGNEKRQGPAPESSPSPEPSDSPSPSPSPSETPSTEPTPSDGPTSEAPTEPPQTDAPTHGNQPTDGPTGTGQGNPGFGGGSPAAPDSE
jgi:hypothetical protein